MISPIVLNWVRGVGSGSSYDPQCLVQDAITLYLTCSHGVPQKPAWCERMREYGIPKFACKFPGDCSLFSRHILQRLIMPFCFFYYVLFLTLWGFVNTVSVIDKADR